MDFPDFDISRFEWTEPTVEVPTPISVKYDKARLRRFTKGPIPFKWSKVCLRAHPLGMIFAQYILMKTRRAITHGNHPWISISNSFGRDLGIYSYQRRHLGDTLFFLASRRDSSHQSIIGLPAFVW